MGSSRQRAVFQKQGKSPRRRTDSEPHTCTQGSQLSVLRQERKAMAGISIPARRVGDIILAFSLPRSGSVKHDTLYPPAGVVTGALPPSLGPAGCPRMIKIFRAVLLLVQGQEEVRVATLAFWAFVSLIFMSPVTGEEVTRRRTKRLQISGPSKSKRKLALIPGSHLTSRF